MTPPKSATCEQHQEVITALGVIKEQISNLNEKVDDLKSDFKDFAAEVRNRNQTGPIMTAQTPTQVAQGEQLTPAEVSTLRRFMIDRNGWIVFVIGALEAFRQFR